MEWTEDIIARLRALWDEGHSTAEIGRRLGVTKNAVVGKAHRLALPPRPSPIRRDIGDAPRQVNPRRITGSTLPPLPACAASASKQEAPAPLAPVSEAASEPVSEAAQSVEAAQPVAAAVVVPAPTAVELAPPPAAQRPILVPAPRARAMSACCWPIGEPGTKSFRFCDSDALTNKPYCRAHAQLAYVKVRDRREEAA